MDEKEIFLTAEGLKKLELELEELKTVKRKEIAEKIKIARDFGDLSENSEYDEAKNEQAQIEEKIIKLQENKTELFENVIDENHIVRDIISQMDSLLE